MNVLWSSIVGLYIPSSSVLVQHVGCHIGCRKWLIWPIVNDVELESIRKELEVALSPDGWRVELDRTGIAFKFLHPLTQKHQWSYGPNVDDSRDEALRKAWLAIHQQPEFADVRGGPIETTRGALLSGLRVAAGRYGWTTELFKQVIWTLRELHAIGLDEAEWLERVGPVPRPPGVLPSKLA